ncbi:P-loop containing nucleoside triphosphate hydrolase protein [Pestalotiopsis sp. NC0098]|nr:P-loop containing nucleoside triphosphate hydrolase protein [Pestalotiopsis sp. NC0098]
MKKPIEGKVRLSTQELPNQKHAAKVFLNGTLILENGLQAGQVVYIESINDPRKRREGVVWPSTDKNLAGNKSVVQLSRALREATHLELGEVIKISDAGKVTAPDALDVVIRDVTPDAPAISDAEKKFVSYTVECALETAEFVFPGLNLDKVLGKGIKRSFIVESVNGSGSNVAKYCANTRAQWLDNDAGKGSEAQAPPGRLEVSGIPGMVDALDKLDEFFSDYDVKFNHGSFPHPSCGIVVQGSRGTGKSMLLNRIADTRWGSVMRIKTTDKPQAIQEYFRNAIDDDEKATIILIDDMRGVVGKERPAATDAVLNGLEELAALTIKNKKRPNVLVVGSCRNYLEDVPEALQTRLTFGRHVTLTIPDAPARKDIIRSYSPNFAPDNFEKYVSDLGDRTHAYTGSDLVDLLHSAFRASQRRTRNRQGGEPIVWEDVQRALQEIRPTAMHDITLKPPTVRWNDIGGYQEVKTTLQQVLNRSADQVVSWKPPKGVLMYGPPGCSKTMTAQAVATESGFNFFAVKGGELLNMYVGETERSIRNLFQRAREASPSVIFFDEIDSIAGNRSGGGGAAGGGVQALTTLLTEMDGFEEMGNVFVLAATNKPDSLDPALMRPGRFDELIYVPLPDEPAREAILSKKAQELRFPPLDIPELARRTLGYSGAEISRICDKAFMPVDSSSSSDADKTNGEPNGMAVLERAIRRTPKGVTTEILAHFTAWRLSRNEF